MLAWLLVPLSLVFGIVLLAYADGSAVAMLDPLDAAVGFLGASIAAITFMTLSRGRPHGALRLVRHVASMAFLMMALIAGYNYREDLLALGHLVAAEIAPPGSFIRTDTQVDGEKLVRIRRRGDGHFIAKAQLNGFELPMLVDTGASTVVLRPADAQKLGINIDRLRYTVPVQTANGTTYAAAVRLKRVAVGSIEFLEIDALVAKPNALRDSLLGMTFLNRLRSYEFSGEYLTLRI